VVSTCNRTEIYSTTKNYLHIAELYCNTVGVSLSDFLQYVNVIQREDAFSTFSALQQVWKARLSVILRSFPKSKMLINGSKNIRTFLIHILREQLIHRFRYPKESRMKPESVQVRLLFPTPPFIILNNTRHIHEKNILLLVLEKSDKIQLKIS
jgi:glutamyl-tRNA reductase